MTRPTDQTPAPPDVAPWRALLSDVTARIQAGTLEEDAIWAAVMDATNDDVATLAALYFTAADRELLYYCDYDSDEAGMQSTIIANVYLLRGTSAS